MWDPNALSFLLNWLRKKYDRPYFNFGDEMNYDPNKKPILLLDFDGVIHSYRSGWQGVTVIPDPPTDGCREAIQELRKTYLVKIHSTRCETRTGRLAIEWWLSENGIRVDEICEHKPPAVLYVDDRGITFSGDWIQTLEAIRTFEHWHKKK